MEERLQKVLAQAGVASRREAEGYILALPVDGMTVHHNESIGANFGP